jgi:hypothetical protein
LVTAGKTGPASLDSEADRIGDYNVWHLNNDSTTSRYQPLIYIALTEQPNVRSSTCMYAHAAFGGTHIHHRHVTIVHLCSNPRLAFPSFRISHDAHNALHFERLQTFRDVLKYISSFSGHHLSRRFYF